MIYKRNITVIVKCRDGDFSTVFKGGIFLQNVNVPVMSWKYAVLCITCKAGQHIALSKSLNFSVQDAQALFCSKIYRVE